MKILHIYKTAPDASTAGIVEAQQADHEVTIVDLTKGGISYDALVDQLFANDRVFCW